MIEEVDVVKVDINLTSTIFFKRRGVFLIVLVNNVFIVYFQFFIKQL